MNQQYEKWFRKIEADRIELGKTLKEVTPDQFVKQPKPGQWSIAEIIAHLITADRLSLGYMKKKSLAIETLSDSGVMEELKMLLFIISQRVPIKYRAPKVVSQQTPDAVGMEELLRSWEKERQDLEAFLNTIPEPFSKRKIYRHPFIGLIDPKLFLQTTYEHYHHHLPQIKRLL